MNVLENLFPLIIITLVLFSIMGVYLIYSNDYFKGNIRIRHIVFFIPSFVLGNIIVIIYLFAICVKSFISVFKNGW